MCLDIQKYKDTIEKNELDNIDNITRVINSYDINELAPYIEFACEDEELDINTCTKCHPDCPNDVRSVYHAYRHYKYYMELTFANVYQIKRLRVFFNIHMDFELEEYSIKWSGHLVFNLKHIESQFNYYITFDFSSHIMFVIKRLFYII